MTFEVGQAVWAHNWDPSEWQPIVRLPGTLVRFYDYGDERHWLVELPTLGSQLSHKESWLEPREEDMQPAAGCGTTDT